MDYKKIFLAVVVLGLLVYGSSLPSVFAPPQPKQCEDGQDNDGDTYIDYPDDPGCSRAKDNDERDSSLVCDDGIDNDGDTYIDYPDDPGCSSPTDTDELVPNFCDDTDGGDEALIRGTMSGYWDDTPYSNTDYCIDTTNLVEYFCWEWNEEPFNTTIDCVQNGSVSCSTGACIG